MKQERSRKVMIISMPPFSKVRSESVHDRKTWKKSQPPTDFPCSIDQSAVLETRIVRNHGDYAFRLIFAFYSIQQHAWRQQI
jgi:hypothetical protein